MKIAAKNRPSWANNFPNAAERHYFLNKIVDLFLAAVCTCAVIVLLLALMILL